MADIVFVRTFVPMELNAFYNPIPNRLLSSARTASSNENQWRMLRTAAELRWDTGTKVEMKEDSKYKEAQRVPFAPAPLTVPTKLVAALPFADKPKLNKKQLRMQRFRDDNVRRSRHVDVPPPVTTEVEGVPDPIGHEKDRRKLIQHLRTLHEAYQEKERNKMITRTMRYKAKRAVEAKIADARNKRRRKDFFARHHGGTKGQRSNGGDI